MRRAGIVEASLSFQTQANNMLGLEYVMAVLACCLPGSQVEGLEAQWIMR